MLAACIVMLTVLGGCAEQTGEEKTGETVIPQTQDINAQEINALLSNAETMEEGEDTEEKPEAEEKGKEAQEEQQSNDAADVSAAQNQESISGDILSLGEESLVLSAWPAREETDAGYSETAEYDVQLMEELKKNRKDVTVRCTDATTYTKVNISDTGADYTEEEGKKADLEEGRMIIAGGKWEGEEFLADRISVFYELE